MDVIKQALIDIKPSREDEIIIDKRIKYFMKRIKITNAKVILGGSGTKGTWLKDANDADIFIQYNYNKYKNKSDKISDILEKDLKKSFKNLERLHGSRDYFQVKENGFTYELIPIIQIDKSSNAVNITDVSPLHAKFVKSQTRKNKKLADEIRLMKQFCKANDLYGAESYITGFSGYMCELLIIHYGSFAKLIRAASKWEEKVIIDIKKFYKNKNIMLEMNKSKTYSPIILVDPVQAERNAAAALGLEKFNQFKKISADFIKKASVKYFREKTLDINQMHKEFIIIEINSLKGKQDVVGAKLLKALEFIKAKLKKEGFVIKKSGWHWDKEKTAHFYIATPKDLARTKIVKGPPTSIKQHAALFRKKHKKTYISNKHINAKEIRKITKAKVFIKGLIKDVYVKERVKLVKVL